jgi:hypothetical protein
MCQLGLRVSRAAARVPPSPTLAEDVLVEIACLDLEGVLVPEIWIACASSMSMA